MSAGLVSTLAGLLGMALVVVAVAGSPAPWWAAVGTAAAELLAVYYMIGQHALRLRAAEVQAEQARPRAVKAAS